MVCTSRNKLRFSLLRTFRQCAGSDCVFVLENRNDSMGQPDTDVSVHAAQTRKVYEMFTDVLHRLMDLDKKMNPIGLPLSSALQAERVELLFRCCHWQTRAKVEEFQAQVKAVVCTADILRKQLHGKPVWMKNSRLQLLMRDEIESVRLTEPAALTLHADCCITARDFQQAIAETRRAVELMQKIVQVQHKAGVCCFILIAVPCVNLRPFDRTSRSASPFAPRQPCKGRHTLTWCFWACNEGTGVRQRQVDTARKKPEVQAEMEMFVD